MASTALSSCIVFVSESIGLVPSSKTCMVPVYDQTYLSGSLSVYSLLCMCVQASGLAHQTFSLLYTVDDVCTLMLQPIETHCACANRAMRGRAAAEHSLQANKSSSVGFAACGDN